MNIWRREIYREIENLGFSKMLTVLKNIEDKYPNVWFHMCKVGYYSYMIGSNLDLSREYLNSLLVGGVTHDIGKIFIPKDILNKQPRLTDEEFQIMRKHSEIGYNIFKTLYPVNNVFSHIVSECILYHHERFDGTGYPYGKSNNQISIFPQIIAIADTFDAMTEDRPYRMGLSKEKAVKEILLHKGTQFNPQLVDTLVNLVNADNILYEKEERLVLI